jgi:hypothetical protein
MKMNEKTYFLSVIMLHSSVNHKLNKSVGEFGSDIFSSDGSLLFCKIREKSVNFEKKYFVTQHTQGIFYKIKE